MEATLDELIVEEYVRRDTPVDEILADPTIAEKFTDAVNSRLGKGKAVDQVVLGKRLLSLRKKGQAKGGLPRLRRSYNGRKPPPKPR